MGAEVWDALGVWYASAPADAGGDFRRRMAFASKVSGEPRVVATCAKAREEVRVALGILLDGESDAMFVFPTTPGAPLPRDADAETRNEWREKTLSLTCACSLAGFPQVTIPMLAPSTLDDGPRAVSFVLGRGRDYAALDAAARWSPRIVEAFPGAVAAALARERSPSDGRAKETTASSTPCASGDACGEPFKSRGNAYFKAGAYANAAREYGEGLRSGGETLSKKWRSVLFSNRAMARLKLGEYAEAEEDCCEAIKNNPRNVKAYLRRGAARSVSGNYLEALEDFESALRYEPKNEDARNEITRMKNILGDADPVPDFE
jgi:tetratricopeptide (TPR) repeat protein